MSLVLAEQHRCLSDTIHLTDLRAASQEVIEQGDVMRAHDGSTGIPGLCSCRAFATRADSIEQDVYLRYSTQFGSLYEVTKFVATVAPSNSL